MAKRAVAPGRVQQGRSGVRSSSFSLALPFWRPLGWDAQPRQEDEAREPLETLRRFAAAAGGLGGEGLKREGERPDKPKLH
jgi:hypothetical protein